MMAKQGKNWLSGNVAPASTESTSPASTGSGRYDILAVRQALQIIDLLAGGVFNLGEIADTLQINRHTVYRQASTLLSAAWVELGFDGRYRLTEEVARIGLAVARSLQPDRSRVLLEAINEATGQTAVVWKYDRGRILCLGGIMAGGSLQVTVPRGERIPLGPSSISRLEGWLKAVDATRPVLVGPVDQIGVLTDVFMPLREAELDPDLQRDDRRRPGVYLFGVRMLSERCGGESLATTRRCLSGILSSGELSTARYGQHQNATVNLLAR